MPDPSGLPTTPDWLKQLLDVLTEHIETMSLVECVVSHDAENNQWLIITYSAPIDMQEDEIFDTEMQADLSMLLKMFDEIPDLICNGAGAHIKGLYAKHTVVISILWEPPEDAETAARLEDDGTVTLYDTSVDDDADFQPDVN